MRDVKVSRNTVRKVIRSGATAFSYERRVQPLPKLGPWRDGLERLLEANEAKPRRERLTLRRIYEALEGEGYGGGYDAVRRYAKGVAPAAVGGGGRGLRAARVLAGRGLPVRLEPRVRGAGGRDDQGEGGACPSVPQPDVPGPRLSAPRARRWCSTPTTGRSGCSAAPAGGASTTT